MFCHILNDIDINKQSKLNVGIYVTFCLSNLTTFIHAMRNIDDDLRSIIKIITSQILKIVISQRLVPTRINKNRRRETIVAVLVYF